MLCRTCRDSRWIFRMEISAPVNMVAQKFHHHSFEQVAVFGVGAKKTRVQRVVARNDRWHGNGGTHARVHPQRSKRKTRARHARLRRARSPGGEHLFMFVRVTGKRQGRSRTLAQGGKWSTSKHSIGNSKRAFCLPDTCAALIWIKRVRNVQRQLQRITAEAALSVKMRVLDQRTDSWISLGPSVLASSRGHASMGTRHRKVKQNRGVG